MHLLSIIVPCYGRHQLLLNCLRSIDVADRRRIQVVVVDDGSDPPLELSVSNELNSQDILFRQPNRGRAAALREGVLRANGMFLMFMDSDDEFVPHALDQVVHDLAGPFPDGRVGMVYDCVNFETGAPTGNLPDGLVATLLGLRADYHIKGDLKEVVLAEAIVASLYSDPGAERRVPTSYIWAGVSGHGVVVTRSLPVVRHRYLSGGMTDLIRVLKRTNPFWLVRTYLRIATASPNVYRSWRFRVASAAKALAVDGGGLESAHLRTLKQSLGFIGFGIAVAIGRVVRMTRRR